MINVAYQLTPLEKVGRRALNSILRDSLRAVGLRWRLKYLPQHFGNQASKKYGYGPRKGEAGSGRAFRGSYTARKLKEKGHTRPLEWSGESKRIAMFGSGPVKATATGGPRGEAQVTIPIRAFNIRPRNTKARPHEEIRAVTHQDLWEISDFLVDEIERRLARIGGGSAFVELSTV